MRTISGLFLLAAATVPRLGAGTMTDVGPLAGGTWSAAGGISANGLVIIGSGDDANGKEQAFRWTQAGGMTNLGPLVVNGWSTALAVSADGSVVVGRADQFGYGPGTDYSHFHAFRWTQAGGMTDLGALGGTFASGNTSAAWGVSADGAVIVGESAISTETHAFRWTQAGGFADIGTLGGTLSSATGTSGDGNVVVGTSSTGGGVNHAFRWSQAGGMTDLGTIPGANDSHAKAVSSDGLVVIGDSSFLNGDMFAFRWTQVGGMTSLGAIAGTYSTATGISADGNVVVGASSVAAGNTHAFRWTQADGMTDLGTLGGANSYASGVSADGKVVVGNSDTASGGNHAFVWRQRVMLDAQDWLGSVAGAQSVLSTSLALTNGYLEGAHHRPLADLGLGRSFWSTGDVASSSRTRDLLSRSGEVGATFAPLPGLLVGAGAGYGVQDQNLANDGAARIQGQYLVAEADLFRAEGGIFSVLLSYGGWRYVADRGYVTGGGVDHSHGVTNLTNLAARLRFDSPTLAKAGDVELKAYVSYSISEAQSDAFTETGGSYAASFGAMRQTAKESRVGTALSRSLGERTAVRLSAEWIHRYDHGQASLAATDVTSTLELSVPTAEPVRDQARFGLDVDHKLDDQTTLSFTAHASGVGESPDVSGAISLRRNF